MYIVYNFIKYNSVTCMKITGETFSFILKEEEPKRQGTTCI